MFEVEGLPTNCIISGFPHSWNGHESGTATCTRCTRAIIRVDWSRAMASI